MFDSPMIDEARRVFRAMEAVAAGFVVFMLSGALIGPLFDPEQAGGAQAPWLRLMWLPIYGLIALMAALRFKDMLKVWLPGLVCLALVAWAGASVYWSIAPGETLRRVVALVFTMLFALYLPARFGGRGAVIVLAGTFLVMALGAVAAALLYPPLGVQHDINAGMWRGLWYEKNQMGAVMAYGALTALAAVRIDPRRAGLWIVTFLLCLGLVVMSRSKTSILCVAAAIAVLVVIFAFRRGAALGIAGTWAGVTGVVGLGAILWLAPAAFFKAIGKDPTLTGRTDIWESLMRLSAKAPMTGYGYAAFWSDGSVPMAIVRRDTGWTVPTAHNGWLDILIQIGWVGVALCAAALILAIAVALLRMHRMNDGGWSLMFLVVFALQSASESFILQQNSVTWSLAVSALALALTPNREALFTPAPAPRLDYRLAPPDPFFAAFGVGGVAAEPSAP